MASLTFHNKGFPPFLNPQHHIPIPPQKKILCDAFVILGLIPASVVHFFTYVFNSISFSCVFADSMGGICMTVFLNQTLNLIH